MPPIYEAIKPTISLRYTAGASDALVREVRLGMEEEGIPFAEETTPNADALSLAWDGAQSSRLEVGIGLDDQFAILHFAKLDREQPLFKISARSPMEKVRALGANAARLVKKQPLKPLDGR